MAISFPIPHSFTHISSGTSYSKHFLHTGSFNLSLTNDPNTAQESTSFFGKAFCTLYCHVYMTAGDIFDLDL